MNCFLVMLRHVERWDGDGDETYTKNKSYDVFAATAVPSCPHRWKLWLESAHLIGRTTEERSPTAVVSPPPRVHRLQPVRSDPPASFLFVSGGRPHPPGPPRPLHVPRGGPRGGIESKIKFNTAECEEGMVQRREKTKRGREGGGSTKRERAQGASGVGWKAWATRGEPRSKAEGLLRLPNLDFRVSVSLRGDGSGSGVTVTPNAFPFLNYAILLILVLSPKLIRFS